MILACSDGGAAVNKLKLELQPDRDLVTVTAEFEVNFLTLAGSGSAQFIAANGDSVSTDVMGQTNPTENPEVLSVVETFTITGGTGRFAGATGGFTVKRSLNAGVTSGSFDWSIVLAKGK